MTRPLFASCALVTLLFATTMDALAQGFGNSGGFGSSGFGASAFGSGFGSSGFGSSGFGSGFSSSSLGSAGFGASRFGSSGFGAAGFGGSGFGTSGFGNSMFGNSGFGGGYGNRGYGATNSGGQNFVGRDAGDMQQVFGQMGRAGTQFFNQMNRNMRRENSRRQSNKTVQNPAQPVRVEVRTAFTVPRPSPTQLASTIRTRLDAILVAHKMSQPTLSMDGDTAVLGGVAASESERDVISQLVALEPGVRDVRNEMTVATPTTEAAGTAPGN
jgi:hypothetical protein